MKIVKIYTDACPFNPYGQGGIEFSDGSALIDEHEQDCCENVYADFSNLDSDIKSYDFKGTIKIEKAKNGFKFGDSRRWFFVPCYNVQNGYYSDNLTIEYGTIVKNIKCYRKGKPIYGQYFIATTTLNNCPVKDDIY